MNRTKIQADILQTLRAFDHCVLTRQMLLAGFTDDVDFERFKAANGLASVYDKGSGQTTFTRVGVSTGSN